MSRPDQPTHWVRCTCVPPAGWYDCCDSCHEDEEEGYDTLWLENVDAGCGIVLGVHACCRGRERVNRRIGRLVAKFGGTGEKW